ncbi:MAG: ATP-dependent helicase [candidate division KSB1 bacterium]|nr:ATP-dependent helicase [candidate division KSB1 bacterium]MDZ7365439.1 ATP-dependent helicase [candidate division KSB1 bacterium]MDZ7403514.1 ATP-dependent helicase [candidate division KSB1 bacterium]
MPQAGITLKQLWREQNFEPNDNQKDAILHVDGPLFLPAGPGSGKTRVLLWRALNLIVFHGVKPEEIFLSTFTEKAALQLKEGLRVLLGMVTSLTNTPYDLSKMYVGTVHSLCQKILADRRFYPHRERGRVPVILDELDQYFHLSNRRRWQEFTRAAGLCEAPEQQINSLFINHERRSASRHEALTNCLALFNRLSEECRDPQWDKQRANDPVLQALLEMYDLYRRSLDTNGIPQTDLSLLQQRAYLVLSEFEDSPHVFKHVIIDEYQDTNTVQELIFFHLAAGSKNLCVVGDDDQALYRFRGATVENFVEFPQRCRERFGISPRIIPLTTNYRSRKQIVDFYTEFMTLCDWRKPANPAHNGTRSADILSAGKEAHPAPYATAPLTAQSFRVAGKQIRANSKDNGVAVVASTPAKPEEACREIAALVRRLLKEGKVQNENQIAFLYPSLKYDGKMTAQVRRMKEALEAEGLKVYAPHAGRFLEVEEAIACFGLYLHIFGKPGRGQFAGSDYQQYHDWIEAAHNRAEELLSEDAHLAAFVEHRREEIRQVVQDYQALSRVVNREQWNLQAPYEIDRMKRPLYQAPGLSERARRSLSSQYFENIIRKRAAEGRAFTLQYLIKRATALDWNLLDLFYQLCGFEHFKAMFDLAERGRDEGPICNLALISKYLSRFNDEYAAILTAEMFENDGFERLFFRFYLYVLFRRGESEYEDADDPFPRGRIPFITIHQAKGLEFPVVILANPRKDNRGPQAVERLVRPFLDRQGEPLDRIAEFDAMRMFYVALSRAKNLLVIAHFKGQGQRMNEPFKKLLDDDFPRIPDLDWETLPAAQPDDVELPKNYSYTGDFLLYLQCPRQYMIYRKYGFAPSRSLTMMFGNLVHRTLDDLHQFLIAQRSKT